MPAPAPVAPAPGVALPFARAPPGPAGRSASLPSFRVSRPSPSLPSLRALVAGVAVRPTGASRRPLAAARHALRRAARVALCVAALPALAAAQQTGASSGTSAPAAKPSGKSSSTTKSTGKSTTRSTAKRSGTTGVTHPNPAEEARLDALWANLKVPAPLPGAILPAKRVIAFYGNPLSKRMGVLGEYPQPEMFARLDREVAKWNAADPSTPVQPALHLIATVAQGAAGKDGKWRYRAHPELIEKVHGWARQKKALLFLDVQIGKSTLEDELTALLPYLQRPDVHLGIDPEFAMTKGGDPGRRVGTYDAKHVNHAIAVLGDLVTKYKLPPKILVVHRFTGPMLTNSDQIRLDPRVQVVIHMDGWGPPYGKRATWQRFIRPYPVQYTGFKLFFHNDTKAGHPLMQPKDLLALQPKPVYVQYQ